MGGGSLNSKYLLKEYLNFTALLKSLHISRGSLALRAVQSAEFSELALNFLAFVGSTITVDYFPLHTYTQIMILLTELQQVKS